MNTNVNQINQYCEIHNIKFEKIGPKIFCKICVRNEIQAAPRYYYATESLSNKKTGIDINRLGIPLCHNQSSFNNYISKYVVQKSVYDAVFEYTNNFCEGIQKNLIFIGGTGTGKTHLACAMLKVLAEKKLRVKFINSYELANRFIENWKNPHFFESNEIDNFSAYELLIIDEYGLYDQKDFQKAYVDKVLLKRYESKKPTVIISNQTNEEIIESLGFRIWSRLNQDGVGVFEFIWGDQRFNKGD